MSLLKSDAIWCHIYLVIVGKLMRSSSHNLNQYWLTLIGALWLLPGGNTTGNTQSLTCWSSRFTEPGTRFNIKMSYQYRKSHCGEKTVVRSSYLHNGISYIGKIPDSKLHGASMGPIWGRQDPGGLHVGPMNFVIWDVTFILNRGPEFGHHCACRCPGTWQC